MDILDKAFDMLTRCIFTVYFICFAFFPLFVIGYGVHLLFIGDMTGIAVIPFGALLTYAVNKNL